MACRCAEPEMPCRMGLHLVLHKERLFQEIKINSYQYLIHLKYKLKWEHLIYLHKNMIHVSSYMNSGNV